MQFTLAVVLGILIAVVTLALVRRSAPAGGAAWLAWFILALGVFGALALVLGYLEIQTFFNYTTAAISLPVAAVILGAQALMGHDRRWQVWLGFLLGLLPALFWLFFVIGEIIFPH